MGAYIIIMDITPESKNLEKILTGLETNYSVPDYQRDYSWSADEVETLWLDLWNSYEQKSEYFMGTVVLKNKDYSDEKFDIVDGQQRLATFSILFSVLNTIGEVFNSTPELLPEVPRDKENINQARRISQISLQRLREASEPDNYFLKLNKKDNQVFQNIIRNTDTLLLSDTELKIIKNDRRLIKTQKSFYKNIYESFSGESAIDNLYKFLVHIVKKLKFISIEVKTDYDAFLLFESLNSKGMDLSVSDLVKNKILMHAKNGESEELLDNWDEMIRSLDESRLSAVDFLRVYWEAIQSINTTKKELYKYINRHIEDENTKVREFSIDIKEQAESLSIYAGRALVFPDCHHKTEVYLRNCGEINLLKYTICYPAIMYAFKYRKSLLDNLTELSLSFLFRWITVGDFSVGGAKKVFDEVLKRMRDDNNSDEFILEPFLKHEEKIGDSEFKASFKQLKVQDNLLAKYIISKVHLYKTSHQTIPNYSEVHLEHVIPQKPQKWDDEGRFVPSAGTSTKDWIYHIGNFLLLNKKINLKIQNSIFSQKYTEYAESPFPDTELVYKQAKKGKNWEVSWLLERSSDLADVAPKIWPIKCQ